MSERIIDKVLLKKVGKKSWNLKQVDLFFIGFILIVSFLIRWQMMPIRTGDYNVFLSKWMEKIRIGGGWRSLGTQISDYASPYMYLMCVLSYITKNDLYALKLVSIFFDYCAAVAIFFLLFEITKNFRKSLFGGVLLLFCPTVILNGAYWCQCDVIYSTFILVALYFLMKEKENVCMIFIGIAFSFKFQTIFIFPFLVIMWIKGKLRFRCFLWIPFIYLFLSVPAWLLGRNWKELILIYFNQSKSYSSGTLNYPNAYVLFNEVLGTLHHADELSKAGIYLTLALLSGLAYWMYLKKFEITKERMIEIAVFTVALVVYFLPHMHERYGFLLDLLAILYGIQNIRKIPITCLLILISLLAYMPYLIEVHIIPMPYLSLIFLGVIVFIGYELYMQLSDKKEIIK